MCLKCKKKRTPYYLREHDRQEDEIEKEEEGKATQRKDKVHIQAHCGECLRLATEKKFMETCLEYWAKKADSAKEAKAQREADKKRPMIKAEMKKQQESHVDYVKSFTRSAGLDTSRVQENNDENISDDKKTQQAKKKNKRKPKKKQVKKAEVKAEPTDSKTGALDKKQESHVDFVKNFTEKAEQESCAADKNNKDEQKTEKAKKKNKRKPKKNQTKKAAVKTEPVDDESAGGAKEEDNHIVVKKEPNAEITTEAQADPSCQRKNKKTKKSKNSGSASPDLANNNNSSKVKPENEAAGDNKSKKKRRRNKPKKASADDKENVPAPSENTSSDNLVQKIADMSLSSPQKATRTSTTTRRVLAQAGDAE